MKREISLHAKNRQQATIIRENDLSTPDIWYSSSQSTEDESDNYDV